MPQQMCEKLWTLPVFEIGLKGFRVIIRINEIIPGVVRRINIDQFDFSEICLLNEFQDVEIIPFDNHVFGEVEVSSRQGRSVPRLGLWIVLKHSALPGQVIP
jgi:hypothetical protein